MLPAEAFDSEGQPADVFEFEAQLAEAVNSQTHLVVFGYQPAFVFGAFIIYDYYLQYLIDLIYIIKFFSLYIDNSWLFAWRSRQTFPRYFFIIQFLIVNKNLYLEILIEIIELKIKSYVLSHQAGAHFPSFFVCFLGFHSMAFPRHHRGFLQAS